MNQLQRRPHAAELETRATVGAAVERFARLTLAQSPQTQRTYRGSLTRFSTWLAKHHAQLHGHAATASSTAPVEAFTADAVAAYLLELEDHGLAGATIRKDRAAINRFAKYLHALRLIDATEILMIGGPRIPKQPATRDSLDADTWARVQQIARARLTPAGRQRTSATFAARDLAVLLLLGACGLRNEEVRALPLDAIFHRPGDRRRSWLRITGKGRRQREMPLTSDVAAALEAWKQARPSEIAAHPLLFPRLGRATVDGRYPAVAPCPPTRADRGLISSEALRKIVAPIMRAAGVHHRLCHPHVLRHTFATLYMQRPDARLQHLQLLMGHAAIDTTSEYLHTSARELEADAVTREATLHRLT